jgi:hypothetical protein
MTGKYCPECHTECGTDACPMSDGRCVRCGKPPVKAAAWNRAWQWCERHGEWHTEPCPENVTAHCCTPAAA